MGNNPKEERTGRYYVGCARVSFHGSNKHRRGECQDVLASFSDKAGNRRVREWVPGSQCFF